MRSPDSLRSGKVRFRFCSFLSRMTPTLTDPPLRVRTACAKSLVSCTGCSLIFTITSPARKPAFSARLPFSTERTSTPFPFFTPKNSPSCGVMFSTISPLRAEEVVITMLMAGMSMSGMWISGIFT